MNANTEVKPPFIWDKEYESEQVRPYLADFLTIKNEMKANNEYPYNDSFRGKIPGIANSANQDTGIYLLQNLADRDQLHERIKAFIDAGGYRLDTQQPAPAERGKLVHFGFYMGGTGWSEVSNVIVKIDESGRVLCKSPRQRNWRTHHDGASAYLFMPESIERISRDV